MKQLLEWYHRSFTNLNYEGQNLLHYLVKYLTENYYYSLLGQCRYNCTFEYLNTPSISGRIEIGQDVPGDVFPIGQNLRQVFCAENVSQRGRSQKFSTEN